jgi:hypothetical protein
LEEPSPPNLQIPATSDLELGHRELGLIELEAVAQERHLRQIQKAIAPRRHDTPWHKYSLIFQNINDKQGSFLEKYFLDE